MKKPQKGEWCVYMLRCGDGSLYTGITNNVHKRLRSHQTGKGSKYTRSHLPVTLVYLERVVDRSVASQREAEIKKLAKQEKHELLARYASSECS